MPPKFPVQQQTNMFPSQSFPSQFPPTSNPFVQQPFGASKTWKQQHFILSIDQFSHRFIKLFRYAASLKFIQSIYGIKIKQNHVRNILSYVLFAFFYRISLNNIHPSHKCQINSVNHVQIQQIHFFNSQWTRTKLSFKHCFLHSFFFFAFSLQWTSLQSYLTLKTKFTFKDKSISIPVLYLSISSIY